MSDFVTKDGKEVSTLNEMAEALSNMPDEDYAHHINAENNDVANWIRDVHNNPQLAEAVQKAPDKKTVVNLLIQTSEPQDPNEPAKFPNEEYEQTHAIGKEDLNMDDTYNKPEEWDAAKEAAHPTEEIQNPAVHTENLPQDLMNKEPTEQPGLQPEQKTEDHPLDTNPATAEDQSPGEGPVPSNQDSKADSVSASSGEEKVPTDLKPPIPGPTLKDRLIPGIIGLILGLVIGYFTAGLLSW